MAEDTSTPAPDAPVEPTTPPEGTEPKPTGDDPQGTEPKGDEPKPKPEDELPEWARKELEKVRGEAANYRTKNKELKEALEKAKTPEEFEAAITEHQTKISELERTLLRSTVAAQHKLPPELADALKGDTEEELVAHAKVLAKFVPADEEPPAQVKGGTDPDAGEGDENLTPRELAEKYGQRRTILGGRKK